VAHEILARWREAYRATIALEENRTQHPFELANGMAHRARRQVKLVRRSTERTGSRGRFKSPNSGHWYIRKHG
jgi:hypothetical protein